MIVNIILAFKPDAEADRGEKWLLHLKKHGKSHQAIWPKYSLIKLSIVKLIFVEIFK